MDIRATVEFDRWLAGRSAWERALVRDRLDRIAQHSHFGDRRYLGGDLFELRWKNGLRVYHALVAAEEGRIVLLLLGGDKNGQERDIARARRLLDREAA